MQTMKRDDGSTFEELFTAEQVKNGGAQCRREQLEASGMKFVRLEEVDSNKYMPHQGNKEIARRVKQALRAAQKSTHLTEIDVIT